MSSHAAAAARKRDARRPPPQPTRIDTLSRFAVPAAAVLLVATLVVSATVLGGSSSGPAGPNEALALGKTAPDFSVTDVVGGAELSRADLEGQPALLFFSEGAACQACMVQTADLEGPLEKAGVQLVSITTDPADVLAQVASDYGITTPLLSDESTEMSSAYGMLGRGGMGHPGQNGHAFALLDAGGKLVWERAYSEMYVPAKQIIGVIGAAEL